MKYYAGIGSRDTPFKIRLLMSEVARKLEINGWTLRSGGAEGADHAFESGATSAKHIFLPWKGFNGNNSDLYEYDTIHEDLAEEFHPKWVALKQGAKKMMIRNSAQIIGINDEPDSKFVICYTIDGKHSGGTGQALRVAKSKDIPIFNLYDERVVDRLTNFINK